jgi:hypothetical protein
MRELTTLETRFENLPQDYPRLRSAALQAARSWEWYSGAVFDLRPLHYERDRLKRGQRLSHRPPLDQDHHMVGFDADGRPVVIFEYSGFLSGKLYYETYRDYSSWPGVVEESHFEYTGRPMYLNRYSYVDERIRMAEMTSVGGSGYEVYEYMGGAVTRINVFHNNKPYISINAAYDQGGLVRLAKIWDTSIELVYERPPPSFTIEDAYRAVLGELVRQVPLAVRDLGIDLPSCCVVLVYQSEFPLDVMVHVGISGEWFPSEMHDQAEVDLSAVAGTARLLAQELALGGREELGRDLLCAAAARLNAADWRDTLPITDDFVVFAMDLELMDVDRNLAACVPPERLARPRAELSLEGLDFFEHPPDCRPGSIGCSLEPIGPALEQIDCEAPTVDLSKYVTA